MAPPPVTLPQGLTTAADDRDHRGQPIALAPRSAPVEPEEAGGVTTKGTYRFGRIDLLRTGDHRTVSQNARRVHWAEVAPNAGRWRAWARRCSSRGAFAAAA